jgi:phosphoribosyl-ATP pyrophosphohydrolase
MYNAYSVVYNKIVKWAADRNLIEGSDSFRQYNKLEEESDELLVGLMAKDKAEIADALGDMFVVMTVIAEQNDLNMLDCIEGAYEEIKDRKGKMVDGMFVKEVAA